MGKFGKPYLGVVNLDIKESIESSCVLECTCDLETCTCDQVCGCDDDCIIYIAPSR